MKTSIEKLHILISSVSMVMSATSFDHQHMSRKRIMRNNRSFRHGRSLDARRKLKLDFSRLFSINKHNEGKKENNDSPKEEGISVPFGNINSLLIYPDTPKPPCLAVIQESGSKEAIPSHNYFQHKMGTTVDDKNDAEKRIYFNSYRGSFSQSLKRWWSKCNGGGGNIQIPPSMPWNQSIWTLAGSFLTLLLLSLTSKLIGKLTANEYYFLMGPMGALATLQYGLTSAPATQPRNIILGQIIAGVVVLPLSLYIPETILPSWFRLALGPALAISTMAKLGVIHPPAGAAAILWASGKYGWDFFALMLLSCTLSLIPCIFINNMNTKRQYPSYWGFFNGISS